MRNTDHLDLRDHQALLLLPITSSHGSLSSPSYAIAAAGRIGLRKLADSSRMFTRRRMATEGRGWPGKQPCRAMQPSISCRSNHCSVYTTLQYDLFPLCRHRKTRRLIKMSHGPCMNRYRSLNMMPRSRPLARLWYQHTKAIGNPCIATEDLRLIWLFSLLT